MPAGPYLSRGRGVGILPKGFGVRFLGFEDGHDVCADFFFWGRWWCGVILLVGVGEDAFFGGDCVGIVYSYILF